MLDEGSNLMSDKFNDFCEILNIEQSISSSSYHHKRNEQEKAI